MLIEPFPAYMLRKGFLFDINVDYTNQDNEILEVNTEIYKIIDIN